jgi:hypothetical protein
MSLFSSILDKLGLGKKASAPAGTVTPRAPAPSGATAPGAPAASTAPAVKPISEVDVVAKLEDIWLHKTVLQKLAANGGNIPQELL